MSSADHSADVIVVGAGPAGIAAICELLAAGKRVLWVDQNPRPGGQIWRAGLPPRWAKALAALEHHPGLRRLSGRAVIAAEGRQLLLQSIAEPAAPALRIEAPQLLLALGARERFLPFPGWTLPGVHGAGGLQALIKNGWPVAGRTVVLAGSGPLLLAAADTARRAGAAVALVAEQAPLQALARFTLLQLPLGKFAQALRLRRGLPYRSGCWVVRALGADKLEAVVLSDGRREWQQPCEALGLGFGLLPNTELAQMLGCRLDAGGAIAVDAGQQSSVAGIYAAGECTGIAGVDKALIEGRRAALQMLGRSDRSLDRAHGQALRFGRQLSRHFALRPELFQLAEARTTICRCEDVCYGELKTQRSGRDAKLQTRCGMGACQGRICGPITEDLFGWSARSLREPLQPAPVASFVERQNASDRP